MRKVIGIVGEGPTDYMVMKEVIDHIKYWNSVIVLNVLMIR